MESLDVLSIAIVLLFSLAAAWILRPPDISKSLKTIMYWGLCLRFCGAFVRQELAADATVYFEYGKRYAEYFTRFDFSPLFDQSLWRGAKWIGTNFVGYPTGFIMTFIGPGFLGTFFAFGLLSFLGAIAYAKAYRNGFPNAPPGGYWKILFFLPSLWFWPSSIGKEALVQLGLGVATFGFAGSKGRANWLVLGLGLLLVFCIRPQVVAVYLTAIIFAYWLNFDKWSPGKMFQGIFILALGIAGVFYSMGETLQSEVDLESVAAYVEINSGRNLYGGSSIDPVGAGPSNIGVAIVNVMFRPFIWEAHNLTALFAAVEVLFIWVYVWYRRREIFAAAKIWRRHRMLRFAVPFVFLYVVALGMNLSNLGLLARQRVLVFPYFFMVIEAGLFFRIRSAAYCATLSGQFRKQARRRPLVSS